MYLSNLLVFLCLVCLSRGECIGQDCSGNQQSGKDVVKPGDDNLDNKEESAKADEHDTLQINKTMYIKLNVTSIELEDGDVLLTKDDYDLNEEDYKRRKFGLGYGDDGSSNAGVGDGSSTTDADDGSSNTGNGSSTDGVGIKRHKRSDFGFGDGGYGILDVLHGIYRRSNTGVDDGSSTTGDGSSNDGVGNKRHKRSAFGLGVGGYGVLDILHGIYRRSNAGADDGSSTTDADDGSSTTDADDGSSTTDADNGNSTTGDGSSTDGVGIKRHKRSDFGLGHVGYGNMESDVLHEIIFRRSNAGADDGSSTTDADDGRSNAGADDGSSTTDADDGRSNAGADDGSRTTVADDGSSTTGVDDGNSKAGVRNKRDRLSDLDLEDESRPTAASVGDGGEQNRGLNKKGPVKWVGRFVL